jgi:hypothetical protein
MSSKPLAVSHRGENYIHCSKLAAESLKIKKWLKEIYGKQGLAWLPATKW